MSEIHSSEQTTTHNSIFYWKGMNCCWLEIGYLCWSRKDEGDVEDVMLKTVGQCENHQVNFEAFCRFFGANEITTAYQ